eukprot:30874-Pelagococcus_subviridis.AAC.2
MSQPADPAPPPIPKRRRTDPAAGRSGTRPIKKPVQPGDEDDINSLFWLVEVRESRTRSDPRRARAARPRVGSSRVFFSTLALSRGASTPCARIWSRAARA